MSSSVEHEYKKLFKYREAQQFLCGLRGATEPDPLSPRSLLPPPPSRAFRVGDPVGMGKSSPRKYPSPLTRNHERADWTPPNLMSAKADLVREIMGHEAYNDTIEPRPPKGERPHQGLLMTRASPPRPEMHKSLPRLKFGPFHVEPTPPSPIM